ncbi:MAG: hypothetical protein COB69_08420 [Phycisphaera sp.]|nr:MAG: hypothetical protein COB69_08420 [Phycisphaera sp.]
MPDDPVQPMSGPALGDAALGEIPWNTRGFRPVAGLAAFVLPGLGHVVLGLPRRGAMVALGVVGLFVTGLLIGGLDAVDSRDDRWWFMAQSLTGPMAFGVDWLHYWLRAEGSVVQGVGRMNEIGMLSCALAGLMNLIAAIDALFPPMRRRGEGAKL